MSWTVEIDDEFGAEFYDLPEDAPLNDSRHPNMKELRFSAADGEWRVAFAFDTKRKAVLLIAGDKSGLGGKAVFTAN